MKTVDGLKTIKLDGTSYMRYADAARMCYELAIVMRDPYDRDAVEEVARQLLELA